VDVRLTPMTLVFPSVWGQAGPVAANRYALPLEVLEASARVPVAEQVETLDRETPPDLDPGHPDREWFNSGG
jgi:hypothetical protein